MILCDVKSGKRCYYVRCIHTPGVSDTLFCDIMHMLRMCCHGEVIDGHVTADSALTLALGASSYSLACAALVLCWIDHGYEGARLEE